MDGLDLDTEDAEGTEMGEGGGVAIFERWEDVPQGVMVMKQVLAERGLRPPRGASPVGWMVGSRRRYALWAVAGAVAIKGRGAG